MCKQIYCPKANDCLRIKAIPHEEQRYNDFIGLCGEKDNYQMLIKIRASDKTVNNEKLPKNESLEIGILNP